LATGDHALPVQVCPVPDGPDEHGGRRQRGQRQLQRVGRPPVAGKRGEDEGWRAGRVPGPNVTKLFTSVILRMSQ
jgi:hypothetical protein